MGLGDIIEAGLNPAKPPCAFSDCYQRRSYTGNSATFLTYLGRLHKYVYGVNGVKIWKDYSRNVIDARGTRENLQKSIRKLPPLDGIDYRIGKSGRFPAIEIILSYKNGGKLQRVSWAPMCRDLPREVRDFAELLEEEIRPDKLRIFGKKVTMLLDAAAYVHHLWFYSARGD